MREKSSITRFAFHLKGCKEGFYGVVVVVVVVVGGRGGGGEEEEEEVRGLKFLRRGIHESIE